MTTRVLFTVRSWILPALLAGAVGGCNCGTDLRLATACISATPDPLAFGTVNLDFSIQQALKVTNCGEAPLNISSVGVATTNVITVPTEQLLTTDCSGNPRTETDLMTLTGGECAEVIVQFAPTTSVAVTNTVVIDSNAARTPVLKVPVSGMGGQISCSGTTAKITATNGSAAVSGTVLPLTNVTLTGSVSPATTSVASYAWSLTPPPNSMAALTALSGSTTSVLCSSAGTYVVKLTVTTSSGCKLDAAMNIDAIPGAGLHVELTWPESYGDLDLHYIGPGGTFYDYPAQQSAEAPTTGGGSDLYFPYSASTFDESVLTPNGTPSVIDWGLNGTTQASNNAAINPTLDVDQLWGTGPENVTHVSPFNPAAGEHYTVMVHYYCSSWYDQFYFYQEGQAQNLGSDQNCGSEGDGTPCKDYGPATAQVAIYFNGVMKWTGSQALKAKDVWTAADIVTSNNGADATITPANTMPVPSMHGCEDGVMTP